MSDKKKLFVLVQPAFAIVNLLGLIAAPNLVWGILIPLVFFAVLSLAQAEYGGRVLVIVKYALMFFWAFFLKGFTLVLWLVSLVVCAALEFLFAPSLPRFQTDLLPEERAGRVAWYVECAFVLFYGVFAACLSPYIGIAPFWSGAITYTGYWFSLGVIVLGSFLQVAGYPYRMVAIAKYALAILIDVVWSIAILSGLGFFCTIVPLIVGAALTISLPGYFREKKAKLLSLVLSCVLLFGGTLAASLFVFERADIAVIEGKVTNAIGYGFYYQTEKYLVDAETLSPLCEEMHPVPTKQREVTGDSIAIYFGGRECYVLTVYPSENYAVFETPRLAPFFNCRYAYYTIENGEDFLSLPTEENKLGHGEKAMRYPSAG